MSEIAELLEQIKQLKGIQDTEQDDLLELIIEDSEDRILMRMNLYREDNDKIDKIPNELQYIIRDVAVKRFNKLNSEGTTKHDEEGQSFTWESGYLDEHLDVLDSYAPPKKERRSAAFFV